MTIMRTLLTFTLTFFVLFSQVSPVFAQTAASYRDRATLAASTEFRERMLIAAVSGAITVLTEDEATPSHAIRVKFAAYVIREPEVVSRRLAVLLASSITADVDAQGVVTTSLTDAQLQTALMARWTGIATALM